LHPVLETGCQALDVELPTLRGAHDRSENWIRDAKDYFAEQLADVEDDTLDIVFLGSIGRREASPESDLDFLVIAHQLIRESASTVPRVMTAVDAFRNDLGLREPGGTGVFGRLVAAADLVERIGLDEDTNAHHTRRVLLLLESVSAFHPRMHDELLGAIINRYLADYATPKDGVPRFLLNDVLRYWRTMTVDYQAKKWGSADPKWGLRYLKLIISRKLMVAGTVASLLKCEAAAEAYFLDEFSMPPLARLAQLHSHLSTERCQDLAAVLRIAEEFATALQDEAFRDEAQSVTKRADIEVGSRFDYFRSQAKLMQTHLESIFFDDFLADRARTYLSF
jgi:hypothetical protein